MFGSLISQGQLLEAESGVGNPGFKHYASLKLLNTETFQFKYVIKDWHGCLMHGFLIKTKEN